MGKGRLEITSTKKKKKGAKVRDIIQNCIPRDARLLSVPANYPSKARRISQNNSGNFKDQS